MKLLTSMLFAELSGMGTSTKGLLGARQHLQQVYLPNLAKQFTQAQQQSQKLLNTIRQARQQLSDKNLFKEESEYQHQAASRYAKEQNGNNAGASQGSRERLPIKSAQITRHRNGEGWSTFKLCHLGSIGRNSDDGRSGCSGWHSPRFQSSWLGRTRNRRRCRWNNGLFEARTNAKTNAEYLSARNSLQQSQNLSQTIGYAKANNAYNARFKIIEEEYRKKVQAGLDQMFQRFPCKVF